MIKSKSLSFSSLHIELLRNTGQEVISCAVASGFLWRSSGRLFLLTNLHNLSGWDFIRDCAISPMGALPTHVKVCFKYNTPIINGQKASFSHYRHFQLVSDQDTPLWFVHPHLEQGADVAALPLADIEKIDVPHEGSIQTVDLASFPINEADFVNFSASPGDDAFVLGFPKGVHAGKMLPVWKRASIASEPGLDVDNLPLVLIDTATREGMSGSPVVYVRKGYTVPIGGTQADAIIGESINFLGVYSGRIGDDELGVQLGRVWKARLVSEIIEGNVLGKLPWDY